MKALKNNMRYELLVAEFQCPHYKSTYYSKEIKNSLHRIFSYIFNHTDVYYLESIDENVLYDYIEYHRKTNFKEVSFVEALRDIEHYLYFLENIKGVKNVPKINLSVNNFFLWSRL